MDVFVSYASEDRERVASLVAGIERAGWSVWWDRQIEAGRSFDREIEKAIDEARCILVIWTQASVDSEWVRTEANEGLSRGILIPVIFDGVRQPLAFRRTQAIELDSSSMDFGPLNDAIAHYAPRPQNARADLSPYVGRSAELQDLLAIAERASRSQGSAVFVSGEAGVGKTRLTSEFCDRAVRLGMLTLVGRCRDMDAAVPFLPLVDQVEHAMRQVPDAAVRAALGENAPEISRILPLLRQHFDDIGEPAQLPPDQERRYVISGVIEFIARAAARQPLVLVFEDLHWADEATCLLLQHLVVRLADLPVLVLGTYRDTDLEPGSAFADTLQMLLRERNVEDLPLERLRRADVEALVSARAGRSAPAALVDLVFSETEGNPFFVEEVYRHLEESGKLFDEHGAFLSDVRIAETEVPRSVRLVIARRLERVSDTCRTALAAGAVVGREFDFGVLGAVARVDDDALIDALEEAVAATLIEDVSTAREARYQFVHEQIRQTLLASLALPRRQRLHLAIANALEGGRRRGRAGEVAMHLYQAGAAVEPERAVDALIRAGEEALAALGFAEALRHFDMALEVAEDFTSLQRAAIHGHRARAIAAADRFDQAIEVYASAIRLAGSDPLSDRLRAERGTLLVGLYRGPEAEADFAAVLEHARVTGERDQELAALFGLARARYASSLDVAGAAERYRDTCEATIALARELGDQRTLVKGLILAVHYMDYWEGTRDRVAGYLTEARQIARDTGDEDLLLDASMPMMRLFLGEPAGALELDSDQITERLIQRRDPVRLNAHYFRLMWTRLNDGRFDDCVATCNAGIKLANSIGVPPVQYGSIRAFALMDQGRYDDAFASLEDEVADAAHPFGAAIKQLVETQLLEQLNAVDAALASARELLPQVIALSRIWMQGFIAEVFARAALRRPNDATIPRDLLATVDRIGGDVRPVARGLLELVRGDVDAALAITRQSLEQTLRSGTLRMHLSACEVELRCLARLERWPEVVERATYASQRAGELALHGLHWRFLADLGAAQAVLGDSAAAAAAYQDAASRVTALAAAIADQQLRESFLADDQAREVLAWTP